MLILLLLLIIIIIMCITVLIVLIVVHSYCSAGCPGRSRRHPRRSSASLGVHT